MVSELPCIGNSAFSLKLAGVGVICGQQIGALFKYWNLADLSFIFSPISHVSATVSYGTYSQETR